MNNVLENTQRNKKKWSLTNIFSTKADILINTVYFKQLNEPTPKTDVIPDLLSNENLQVPESLPEKLTGILRRLCAEIKWIEDDHDKNALKYFQ